MYHRHCRATIWLMIRTGSCAAFPPRLCVPSNPEVSDCLALQACVNSGLVHSTTTRKHHMEIRTRATAFSVRLTQTFGP